MQQRASSDYVDQRVADILMAGNGEGRLPQLRYGVQVSRYLRDPDGILLMGGATGVGKTRGYAAPTALRIADARNRGEMERRAFISTSTCDLARKIKEEITCHVLPGVKAATGQSLSVGLLFGIRNYVSAERAREQIEMKAKAADESSMKYMRALLEMSGGAVMLDDIIAELGPIPAPWSRRDLWVTPRCDPDIRKQIEMDAAAASGCDIVIQTHARTSQDLTGKNSSIVADTFIVDEADESDNAITSTFTSRVNLTTLAKEMEAGVQWAPAGLDVIDIIRTLEKDVRAACGSNNECNGDQIAEAHDRLKKLMSGLGRSKMVDSTHREVACDASLELDKILRSLKNVDIGVVSGEVSATGDAIIASRSHRYASTITRPFRRGDVGRMILTSATLARRGAGVHPMQAAARRYGIKTDDKDEQASNKPAMSRRSESIEPSSFGKISFFLAGPHAPRPLLAGGEHSPEWVKFVKEISASVTGRGRTLVLVPSFRDCSILEEIDGALIHRQGTRLSTLIESFKDTPGSTLVTPSGWTGLDLPGLVDNLIIPRIRRAPPSAAGVEAHAMSLRQFTDDASADRVAHARAWAAGVEESIRAMAQGIGRGIRTPASICNVYILDSRFPVSGMDPDYRTPTTSPHIGLLASIPSRFLRSEGGDGSFDRATILFQKAAGAK